MSRISKQRAAEVAKHLTIEKSKRITELKIAFQNLVTKEYLKTIPKDVKKVSESNSGWFYFKSTVYVRGRRLDYRSISLIEPCVIKRNYTWLISDELDLMFFEKKQQIDDLEEELKILTRDIENAIYAIGSMKRLKEEWPEAYEAVPKSPKAIQVCLTDIKNRISTTP